MGISTTVKVHALTILLIFLLFLNLYFSTEKEIITGLATNGSNTAAAQVCINHLPEIESISDQTASVGALFQFQVIASDADDDTLTYADDTPLFVINSATGLISFTPAEGQQGSYTITITVADDTNCRRNNDTDTFNLDIINRSQEPPPPEERRKTPPGPRRGPGPSPGPAGVAEIELYAPSFQLKIVRVYADGKLVFDFERGIRLAEYSVKPNQIISWEIVVKNKGFNELTNVRLSLEAESARIISLNPQGYRELLPNQEVTFTAQLRMGEEPVRAVIRATANEDEDIELVPIVFKPTMEAPEFGFEIPWYIPAFIAIPLLFFLGYSIFRYRELIRNLIQNFLTALLALLLRRTYFIDEDMLRKLIQAKRLNKFLNLYVLPNVHVRYAPTYKNLKTFELSREDMTQAKGVQQKHRLERELSLLIVMALKKPHPRIYTAADTLPERTKEAFKKIKFINPLKRAKETKEKFKVTGAELVEQEQKRQDEEQSL